VPGQQWLCVYTHGAGCVSLPAPLSVRVVALLEALGVAWSPTIVDVDDERLNVFARGARCVSLSSTRAIRGGHGTNVLIYALLVSFQDMVAAAQRWLDAGRQTDNVRRWRRRASGGGGAPREGRCW
jgi:hypothetical protein